MVEKMERTIFKCSNCKEDYDYLNEAQECEKKHIKENRQKEIDDAQEFTITDKHIKLLKRMNVDWWSCEFGSPAIDPKRPYGNSDVIDDMAEIIGIKKNKLNWDNEEECWSTEVDSDLYWLHREMQIVLQIILTTAQISVGKYKREDKYVGRWEKCSVSAKGDSK